jgi:hypothetical protein
VRRNLTLFAAALLALSSAAVACDSASATTTSSRIWPACPASAPAAKPTSGGGEIAQPDPATAVLCQYRASTPEGGQAGRIVLRRAAAAGLAAVLDSVSPVTALARKCDGPTGRLPFTQVVILSYRTGQRRTVAISQTDCGLALVTAGGSAGVLAGQVESDLQSLAMVGPRDLGQPAPGLIGLTVSAAQVRAHGRSFSVSFDGAAIDRSARFGTVIFQTPTPGLRGDRSDSQVGLVLAVRPEPACTASQLRLDYRGGQPGAGSDFGALVLRDVSARPCRVAGPVRITGVSSAGHPVTLTLLSQVLAPGVLSPQVTSAIPAGSLAQEVSLTAEYRDDPSSPDGNCTSHWVIPARWSVRLPGGTTVSARNADPADQAKLVRSGGFVTCRGRFSLPSAMNYLVLP